MNGFGHFELAMAGQRRTVGRAVRDLQTTFSSSLESDLPLAMLECAKTAWRHLGPFWILGTFMLAFTTWACLQIGIHATTSVPVYLIIAVLLSLIDSAISSAIFSVIVVLSLDYLFFTPIYSFKVGNSQHVIALFAFLFTSLATGLVRRIRDIGWAQCGPAPLLNLTHNSVFVRDSSDVITHWNRRAAKLYGKQKEEAMDQVAHQLLQATFPTPIEEISVALSYAGRWEGELIHSERDSGHVSAAGRRAQQTGEQSIPVGTLERNNDVTERKWAEASLRRNQAAYLAEAQKLSHTGSFGWDLSTGEIFWSEETFRIFECDPAAKPSIELVLGRIHPGDRAAAERVIDRAARLREAFDFEHRLLMPDGSVKTLRVVAHAVTDEPGKLQFVGAIMDITQRKKTEEALLYSEQRYQSLFQAMAASFWELDVSSVNELLRRLRDSGVVDFRRYFRENPGIVRQMLRATRIVDVNDQTVTLFGRGCKRELLGNAEPFWPEESWQAFAESVLPGVAGKPAYSAETRMRRLDGSHVDVLFTACNLPTARRAGTVLVGIIDLSERNRAQYMLQQVQADFAHAARVSMLGELTASIAHELNQPLAAIATSGEASLRWLDRPQPDVEEVRASTQRMLIDARRASDIISRVRAMATRRGPERMPLSLDDVIREALLFLRHEVQAQHVTVSQHIDPRVPQVLADRTQLQQVIVNLAVNAMQAMEQAGTADRRLTFRTCAPDETSVLCIVEDSGPGIAPEHQPRLFESFFTTKDCGLGMGLSICRSIIEAHGGRITADNQAGKGGATLSFTLPANGGPE